MAKGLKTKKTKSVHHVLPSFSPRDAIGNEVVLMQDSLRRAGFVSEIFCEHGSHTHAAEPFGSLFRRDLGHTALIYHFSVASGIPALIAPLPVTRLVRYQNITPAHFFSRPGEMAARNACSLGRKQLPLVGIMADGLSTPTRYNAGEIEPYCRVRSRLFPLFRDYEKLEREPADPGLLTRLGRGLKKTLLFVGRVTPNKCQHDLALLLHLAKRFISMDLRLILVGGFFSEDYKTALHAFTVGLGLKLASEVVDDADVIILNNVKDPELAAIYRHAQVFISLSEHEGFGVPLTEAMFFEVPILAHAATAVPETVGDAGIILDKNDWSATLGALRALLQDEELRLEQRAAMRQRRQAFDLKLCEAAFLEWLEDVLP